MGRPKETPRFLDVALALALALTLAHVPPASAAAPEPPEPDAATGQRTPDATTQDEADVRDGDADAGNEPKPRKFSCVAQQQDGPFRLVPITDTKTNACTGFEVHDARGRTISLHRNAMYGGGRFVSDLTGRRVVFIADFPTAKLLPTGVIEPLGRPRGQRLTKQIEAVIFFYDGRKVGSHRLETLLHRPFLVNVQREQIRWLSGNTAFLRAAVGKTLTLTTTSFRAVTFDTLTGQVVTAIDTPAWNRCDVLVYGNISAFADGTCGAKPYWVIKGNIPKALRFELDDKLAFTNGMQTACLERAPATKRDDSAQNLLRATQLFPPMSGLKVRP